MSDKKSFDYVNSLNTLVVNGRAYKVRYDSGIYICHNFRVVGTSMSWGRDSITIPELGTEDWGLYLRKQAAVRLSQVILANEAAGTLPEAA